MSDLTVTVFFEWLHASADPRQYNQQRTVLCPNIEVAVNVPLKGMYIHNAEEILQAQIASEGDIKPILTPLGMVYADNVLRAAYSTLEGHEDEDELNDNEIDWDEGEYKEPANDKSLVDDLFEDEEEFSDGDADVDWEDDEKVVLEKLKDDSEFPVEELIDGDDEDELDEILWEN